MVSTKTLNKILDYVAGRGSCCTTPMVWTDRFPKSSLKTVRAYVQTLVEAGRVRFVDGADHPETLELTDAERRDRELEAGVARLVGKNRAK